MKNNELKEGDIFCIPLFLEGVSGRKHQRQKYNEESMFAFGRFIENRQGGGLLIEIFHNTSNLKNLSLDSFKSTNRLFDPIMISGMEFSKNRWRIILNDEEYDKSLNSRYNEINLVLGASDDLRLKHLATNEEKPISKTDAEKYEAWRIWDPMSIENRIRKSLENK